LHIIKNKYNIKNRGAPKSVGPVPIDTFAIIVNPTLDGIHVQQTGAPETAMKSVVHCFYFGYWLQAASYKFCIS